VWRHIKDLGPSICRTIANAAKLLSEELYTKPTHFILELVQNADDCSYDEGIQPELQFDLFRDALLLSSNEVGFEEANVRAICNLGGSTKNSCARPQRGGFTGEKGEDDLQNSSWLLLDVCLGQLADQDVVNRY
jgi:hypothetical protein